MTRFLQALAVIGGLLIGVGAPASASADYYAVVTGPVGLRAGPGVGFVRLATIPAGNSLWVEFCRPKWCSVVWRNLHGWVARAYLGIDQGPSAPSYDDYYYYQYDFGYPYPYPYPWPRPHKPPHCKPGKDCHPPPHCKPGKDCGPPHCMPGQDCKPPHKPGDWPPHWRNKPEQTLERPHRELNGEPKFWKKDFEPKSDRKEFYQQGPTFSGPTSHESTDDRFDNDRRPPDRRRWDE